MTGMIRNTGFFAIFLQSAVKAVCCHNLSVGFKDIYSISQSMLTNYENGNGTPRDESIWEKLSQIFGVSKSHVMGLTMDIETANKTKQLKVVVDTSQPISIQPKNQTDLDVLIKLDMIDNEDMKEVSEFLDKLLAQEKYEGRRESNVKYVVE